MVSFSCWFVFDHGDDDDDDDGDDEEEEEEEEKEEEEGEIDKSVLIGFLRFIVCWW